jgi:hypothetical protein
MVVPKNWSNDWLSQNAQRSYPLMDGMSALDKTGSFAIPTDFLLDICFSCPGYPNYDPSLFHVLQVASYSSGYVVTLGYDNQPMAAFTVASATHAWGQEYTVVGCAGFSSFTGRAAVGNLDNIDDQPAGVWNFTPATAALQPRCIIPVAQGLAGIQILSNGSLTGVITGLAILQEGTNVHFRVVESDGVTRIYVDAVGNSDYTLYTCDNQRTLGPPIRTVSGLGPNTAGDFLLMPGTCTSFGVITSGLLVNNTCSQPCCGCTELSVLNTALQGVRDEALAQQNTASQLAAQYTVLDQRLSDLNGRL